MNIIREVLVKVVAREKKNRILWDSYYLFLEILEAGAQTSDGTNIIHVSVTPQQYHKYSEDTSMLMQMYRHSDGKWYTSEE